MNKIEKLQFQAMLEKYHSILSKFSILQREIHHRVCQIEERQPHAQKAFEEALELARWLTKNDKRGNWAPDWEESFLKVYGAPIKRTTCTKCGRVKNWYQMIPNEDDKMVCRDHVSCGPHNWPTFPEKKK